MNYDCESRKKTVPKSGNEIPYRLKVMCGMINLYIYKDNSCIQREFLCSRLTEFNSITVALFIFPFTCSLFPYYRVSLSHTFYLASQLVNTCENDFIEIILFIIVYAEELR